MQHGRSSTLSSPKRTLREKITLYVSNATRCKVICFVALESMIHLQTLVECVLYCVANANSSLTFSFLSSFFFSSLVYSKIALCGIICRNMSTSLCLAAVVDHPFCFECAFKYSIISSFNGMHSKAVMKYLYDSGKVSRKIMTMFSLCTNISRQTS
jgi:hypothetical protein